MIVPMKKVAILVQAKDAVATIEKLRMLGVLHVEHKQPPTGDSVSALKEDISLVDLALRTLTQEEFSGGAAPQEAQRFSDWKFTARHIVELGKRANQLKDYALTLKNKISFWQTWGDFQPGPIDGLKDKGILVRLYQIPAKEIKNLPDAVIVKKLSVIRGIANCVVISRKDFKLPFKEAALPQMRLKDMRSRLSEDERTMAAIKTEIRRAECYRQAFLQIKRFLEAELEFQQALSGMGRSSSLSYLTGYVPEDAHGLLRQTAKAQRWGVTINDPDPEDRVPTLIRNPRWISIIRPVFKLIELVPGYRELDISLWFLVFFSIFFGMLIGDAGIGLIFAGLTFLSQRKWGKQLKEQSIFILFYISSACAVLWGVLSGTFFGQEWLSQAVQPLIPALRNDKTIQSLCFLLGAIHLSIAHAWRGILKAPGAAALAEVGWIAILWGAFFLARMLVLGVAFPGFAKWLFIGGAGLIILFTDPNRNPLKGISTGLGSLLLNAVNSFTDVVSYVRLFAVGLATVAVADAFNKMALEIGFNSLSSSVITTLILILGHSLNILLAPMSILVHGVRLNVLEFCNHIDIKWSGFAYKPLKGGNHGNRDFGAV